MRKFFLNFLFIIGFFVLTKSSYALTFDLIPPSGQLERGQEIKFTINVDTEGKSYQTTQIGMKYETQYLEYISVSSGNTFSTISANEIEKGKLIISGTSNTPYSGSGVFAYVTFKIIANDSGSTQLCVLFNPETTPTIAPTSPPRPTALPTSGVLNNKNQVFLGLTFLTVAATGFFFLKG